MQIKKFRVINKVISMPSLITGIQMILLAPKFWNLIFSHCSLNSFKEKEPTQWRTWGVCGVRTHPSANVQCPFFEY